MHFDEGTSIGDWIVEAPLGAGGMGSVFRCHNRLTPRIRAAVKVVDGGTDPAVRERFVREVEALEGLQHPAIVRVKGWGDQGDVLWLAMDLVEGEDLHHRLRSGPLAQDQARRVFRELAEGLAHAHAREVFHRDIKPANVLLQPDGSGRIVDFGIAIHHGRTRLSAAGVIPGTPAYLAPEVFGGAPSPRALDVYAFGQLLYEALLGEPAFPEPEALTTTQAIAHIAGRKLQSAPLDPGPDFAEDLRALVRRTTHPDPNQRLLDLDAVVAGFDGAPLPGGAPQTLDFSTDIAPAPTTTASPQAPTPPPPEPPPSRAWLGIVALGLLATLGLGSVWFYGRPGPLAEKHVRLLYLPDQRALAEEISAELVADGATTDLEVLRQEHPSSFGKLVPFGPENEGLATSLAARFADRSDVRIHRPAPESDDIDVVFWVRSNR